jgi:DNA-binding IscR family transcriptional regulator
MGYHLPSSYILAMPLAPLGRYILLVMNDMGWPCWPSIETLAKRSGIPRRTLQTVLGHLRKGGVLKSSGNGKSLTWEMLEVPSEVVRKVDVEVRRSGANRRRNGASPAPIRRTRCAVTAHGSEPENEPEKEPRRLRPQQLEELRATPAEEDAPGTRYESLAEAIRQRLRADVPPTPPDPRVGNGGVPNHQDAAEAWRRLKLLKEGRLTA